MSKDNTEEEISFAFKPNKISRQLTSTSAPKANKGGSSSSTPPINQSETHSPLSKTPIPPQKMSPSTSSFFKNTRANQPQQFRKAQKNSNGNFSKNQSPALNLTHTKSENKTKTGEKGKSNANESNSTGNNNAIFVTPKTVKSLNDIASKLKSFASPAMSSSSVLSDLKPSEQLQHSISDTESKSKKDTANFVKIGQPVNQLKKSLSQSDLNSHLSKTPSWANPTSSTKARQASALNKVKSEPNIVSVSDSDEDAISAIATSFKKRLNYKDRTNSEAKTKIENLQEILHEKEKRIDQLEEDARVNTKIVDHILSTSLQDNKRMDALDQSVETFNCIFHTLKNMLETGQKARDASEEDFQNLSEIVRTERSKQKDESVKIKENFKKMSETYDAQYQELCDAIKDQQNLAHKVASELKLLFPPSVTIGNQNEDTDFHRVSHLTDILIQIKDISKELAFAASNIQQDHRSINSVILLAEGNRQSSKNIFKFSQELEDDFKDVHELFESLQKQVEDLKKEKEVLELTVDKLNHLSRNIREEVKSEFYDEQNQNNIKRLEMQAIVMNLRNEKLTWEIEKRDLIEINDKLKKELRRVMPDAIRSNPSTLAHKHINSERDVVIMFDDDTNSQTNIEGSERASQPAKSKSDSLLTRKLHKKTPLLVISDSSEEREDEQNEVRGERHGTESTNGASQKKLSEQRSKTGGIKKPPKPKIVESMKSRSGTSSDEQNNGTTTRKYNTRRSSIVSKAPLVLPNESDSIEETTEPSAVTSTEEKSNSGKKRRRIRKLPGNTNDDLDDSDDCDISKKITKAIQAALPETAKDAHISKKKK